MYFLVGLIGILPWMLFDTTILTVAMIVTFITRSNRWSNLCYYAKEIGLVLYQYPLWSYSGRHWSDNGRVEPSGTVAVTGLFTILFGIAAAVCMLVGYCIEQPALFQFSMIVVVMVVLDVACFGLYAHLRQNRSEDTLDTIATYIAFRVGYLEGAIKMRGSGLVSVDESGYFN